MSLNIQDDQKKFDGLRTVRLIKSDGSYLDFPDSIRRLISQRENVPQFQKNPIATGGDYEQAEVTFSLLQSHVQIVVVGPETFYNYRPEVGDVIRDADGTNYSVMVVDYATLNARFRVWCKNSGLNGPGAVTGSFIRATWQQDADGAQYAHWTQWTTATVKIHEIGSRVEEEYKRRTDNTTHIGYLSALAGLLPTDRLRVGTVDYDILKIYGKDTLAALWSLDLRTTQTPTEV